MKPLMIVILTCILTNAPALARHPQAKLSCEATVRRDSKVPKDAKYASCFSRVKIQTAKDNPVCQAAFKLVDAEVRRQCGE